MSQNNLERMIKLADEFFATKNDPSQISVDEKVMARLREIHPNSMNEKATEDGPVAWAIVLPTTRELMGKFIGKKITEKELLDRTPPGEKYDAIYFCSVLVLPEYRGKGYAKKLVMESVRSICKDHSIECFFYWGFSAEGERLARCIAEEFHLPLFQRGSDPEISS